ncbi:FadR/GntR family transcriptional regulator [Paenibacillus beijingensis]|uniref:GntR family transcriptional regulator n=1 Tax=Paenibacillus beijingensis TaxID=1126833 RepID=A0A0D5NE90_9BACL|nr:FadR/GntR family transcriptional regulator [Paenibacillus beijingensis]AJY73571.1 GntR family transcriptional regulator [Paenibacillus beijingensis]
MKKIKKVQTHEMVSKEIKDYIQNNQLKKGDKLPSAEKIMATLGVGRSSIREAIRYLEALDVVEVLNGKGIFVKEPSLYQLSTKITIENEKSALLQLCEVRRGLEGIAVELAAVRATQEHLDEMWHYYELIGNTKGTESSIADMKFHQAIYKASDNIILQELIGSIWNTFVEFWRAPFGHNEFFHDSYPFHKSMVEAIEERNPQKAREEFNKMMDVMVRAINEFE